MIYLFGAVGLVYAFDKYLYYECLTRTLRSFISGVTVAIDYKVNFRQNPPFADSLAEVHARNADRLYELLRANGGLYHKVGQAVAMNVGQVLPEEFQKKFARMFDDTPQHGWSVIEKVIREEFGKSPEDVFGVSFTGEPGKGVMERKARASASVAQVHWARLPNGEEVAIKIQKPEIITQMKWDLWAFKVLTNAFAWSFDLPLASLVPYISERLALETDFINEANNSDRMKACVAQEPRLNGKVYIPKVYREFSSKRVMTAEWIEGVRLFDKDTITAPWKGQRGHGSPGCRGEPLDGPSAGMQKSNIGVRVDDVHFKPERNAWRGKDGKGGLGLTTKEVMQVMIDLFSAQTFLFGFLHADPHPGNIFIRRQPNGQCDFTLIDHGLYVDETPEFRQQYCLFWRSLLALDNKTLGQVTRDWGINNADFFASATLMRPYQGSDPEKLKMPKSGTTKEERMAQQLEMEKRFRKGIRDIFGDQSKLPRELIFLGRNQRIVMQNNQFLGSPVNRIKIIGNWASRSLTEDPNLTMFQRWRYWGSHLVFKLVMFTSDIAFYTSKLRQWMGKGSGLEAEIEAHLSAVAKDLGVDLKEGMFKG